jgi:hypothetical protein
MSAQPSFFEELKQILISYFESRIQLYKIGAYEKIAKVMAVLFSSIVITILAFFMLFFLSISGGYYFATLLNSNALGFLIIFGLYVILLIIVIVYRKTILEKYITDKVIEQLFDKEDNE